MKSLKDFIIESQQMIMEKFINVFKKNEMEEYGDVVWDMLKKSYAYCGGLAGVNSIKDVIDDTDMWKMVKRNGKITAVKIYKFKNGGRKAFCCGTDGTDQGKSDMRMMYKEDGLLKDRKAYAELSGPALSTALNEGNIPLPAVVAQEILAGKKIEICEDGWFYLRYLDDGKAHHKCMCGNPPGVDKQEEPSPELIKELKGLAKKYFDEDEENNKK